MVSLCKIGPAQSDGSMNNLKQIPRLAEDNKEEVSRQPRHVAPSTTRRPARWSAHRRRDAWFLLLSLLVGSIVIVVLSGGISQLLTQAPGTQSTRASLAPSQRR